MDEPTEHHHIWVDLYGGRVFTNIKDSTDSVVYQGCNACPATRSVKVVPAP